MTTAKSNYRPYPDAEDFHAAEAAYWPREADGTLLPLAKSLADKMLDDKMLDDVNEAASYLRSKRS